MFLGKPLRHWVVVCSLTLVGFWLSRVVDDSRLFLQQRHQLFQFMTSLAPRSIRPRFTSVVTISDADYWQDGVSGTCAAIANRYRLAKLIQRLGAADAAAIAIDFRLDPELLPENAERACQSADWHRLNDDSPLDAVPTQLLQKAIADSAGTRPIIVASVLKLTSGDHVTVLPSVVDNIPSSQLDLRRGFIDLPSEKRAVPLRLARPEGAFDSFALATASAYDPDVLNANAWLEQPQSYPYVHFLSPTDFRDRARTASEIFSLTPEEIRGFAQHRIVLIGGDWSINKGGLKNHVDVHDSPAGPMTGVFIHANYIEAILDERLLPLVPNWLLDTVDVLLVLGSAAVLAIVRTPIPNALVSTLICLAWIAINYIAVINFGAYFDSLIPLLLVIALSLAEQVIEWRRIARRHVRLASLELP